MRLGMAQLVCGDGMTVGRGLACQDIAERQWYGWGISSNKLQTREAAAWLQFADRYSVLVASILGVVPSRQPWLFGATSGRPCIGLGVGSAGSRAS